MSLALLGVLLWASPARATYEPKIVVVMCQDSYDESWAESQAGVHGLVGLAGLVGAPYETRTLQELIDEGAGGYSSIWFARCDFISTARFQALQTMLSSFLSGGGSVLMDGPLGLYYNEGGQLFYRGGADMASLLNISTTGWTDVVGYTVKTSTGVHPIAVYAGVPSQTHISQPMPAGTNIIGLADDSLASEVTLLELESPDGQTRFPYLSVSERSGRVLAISGYASNLGAATMFRNSVGFFDNLVLPYVIEATLWLLGPGELQVGLQLSHTPMTAVARVDGDYSEVSSTQDDAFNYLHEMAVESGVVTVYGLVTNQAPTTGWQTFRTYGQRLESSGGMIASHSHTHPFNMSVTMDATGWQSEVDGSLTTIESELSSVRSEVQPRVFINPGAGIRLADFGSFFGDIDIYVTHGFEMTIPYGSGVFGFDLPAGTDPRPVLYNAAVPDAQWFYTTGWQYTVTEAAALQGQIVDYFYNRVGRGALYSEMWHDYGIWGLVPVDYPGQPLPSPPSTALLPFYDVNRNFYVENRVYAPSVAEVADKLMLAKSVSISSTEDPGTGDLTVTLGLFNADSEVRPSLSGMGLRINHATDAIASVTIGGAGHHAFTHDTVILPATSQPTLTLSVSFGTPPATGAPRLTYTSKPFSSFTSGPDAAEMVFARVGETTRFCLVAEPDFLALGADRQAREGDGELCGRTAFGSSVTGVDFERIDSLHGLRLRSSERRIIAQYGDAMGHTLIIGEGAGDLLDFESGQTPVRLVVDGQDATPVGVMGRFQVTVPVQPVTVLQIVFSEHRDSDQDGWSDALEALCSTDPGNPADYPSDIDSDGVCDVIDNDDDGDGWSDVMEALCGADPGNLLQTPHDLDGDGLCDTIDEDDDGDGWVDGLELLCGADATDSGDVPTDLDGDGLCDALDSDLDGDGWENDLEVACGSLPDAASSVPPDNDGDGRCDAFDADRDGDGWPDEVELLCGTDPSLASSAPEDLDSDTLCDLIDGDDDGDGWSDQQELLCGSDPRSAAVTPVDVDGDTLCDALDSDDDDDGWPDAIETACGAEPTNADDTPADLDQDGVCDRLDEDDDGDTWSDLNEEACGTNPASDVSVPADLDHDHICDAIDPDIDGDGFDNETEDRCESNPANAASFPVDSDGDGICDAMDGAEPGGGGCSSSNTPAGPAALWLMLMLMLLLRMRRHRRVWRSRYYNDNAGGLIARGKDPTIHL